LSIRGFSRNFFLQHCSAVLRFNQVLCAIRGSIVVEIAKD
jgi:hypothetical protein